MPRARVKESKDGKKYVERDDFLTSIVGQSVKLYVLSSADSHYYQLDVSAVPATTWTDRGTTAPTDGVIVIGG